MKKIEDYRLELEQYANNFDNKGQDYLHTISTEFDYECYKNMMVLMGQTLTCENNLYDELGEEELKKYEKWLIDGEF